MQPVCSEEPAAPHNQSLQFLLQWPLPEVPKGDAKKGVGTTRLLLKARSWIEAAPNPHTEASTSLSAWQVLSPCVSVASLTEMKSISGICFKCRPVAQDMARVHAEWFKSLFLAPG